MKIIVKRTLATVSAVAMLSSIAMFAACGGHEHSYSSDWSKDSTHHWHVCTGCEEVSGKAEHNWDDGVESGDTITYTCEDCGATKAHNHTYATEWSKDETHHWYAATCEHSDAVSAKAEHEWDEGVEEGDVVTYTCEDCGATKTHTHTYSDEYKYDNTNHWHEATCEHTDKVGGTAAHLWGDPVEVNGEMVSSCECGATHIEGHEHSYEQGWTSDATNHWHASACGHADQISALGAHAWGEEVVDGDTVSQTCTTCEYVKSHTHTYATEWSKDETKHWKAATCEHDTLVKDEANHEWGEGVVEGSNIVYTCECGQTKTEIDQSSEPFAYESYLVKHDEGSSATYVFEAESTDLRGKSGPGWSGTSQEGSMTIGNTGLSGGGGVSYLAMSGVSVNFLVVSDRDVENATLSFRVGAEFINMVLNPENYDVRVDYASEVDLLPVAEGGALGEWDNFFLNFDFEGAGLPDTRETYYITSWACEEIAIDAEGISEVTGVADFVITTTLKLKKGVNSISFITNNDASGLGGTLAAVSPVIDAIKITTDAQLGMYGQQDNGYGTNGCKISG